MRMPPFHDDPSDGIYITTPGVPQHPQSLLFLSQLVWNLACIHFWLPNHFWPWAQEARQPRGRYAEVNTDAGAQGADAARVQEIQTLFLIAIYDQWFSQKLNLSFVWVTWYWDLADWWLSQLCCTSPLPMTALCYWFDRENRMIGSSNAKKFEKVWVATIHTVMSNQISQEQTFKNGYRPLLKFS